MSGTLYVVATPIGNLSDVSGRALETLRSVSLILAEDTRVTSRLLARYEIRAPLTTYQAHSSEAKEAAILERLRSGDDVALVSDAGTPAIQDPGGRLVEQAWEAGIPVVAIPGPSAVTHALSVAGFPADSFYFAGFLPQKKGRQTALHALPEKTTIVLFESGPRIVKLIGELTERFGPKRSAWVGRELTKLHEEARRGPLAELARALEEKPPRGEYTLVVGPR
jgi:16S rRNA (cytidine1402-2'-O)-methyltransferase